MLHICPRGQLVSPGLLVCIRLHKLTILTLLIAVQTAYTDSTEVRLNWTVKPGDAKLSAIDNPQSTGIPNRHISASRTNIQSDGPLPSSDLLVRSVEPGMQLQLECTIENQMESQKNQNQRIMDHQTSVFLLCPLSTGVCLEDCKSTPNVQDIACEELETRPTHASRRIRYHITQITGRHNGTWVCQNKGVSSERHELKVSDAPYIESLTASKNPVAAGSAVRLTCIAAPSPSSYAQLGQHSSDASQLPHSNTDIQFTWHRLHSKKGSVDGRNPISSHVEQPNAFTSALEVQRVDREEDAFFQCTVVDKRGRRATRQIQLDVHYTPKSIRIETVPPHNRPVQVGTRCRITCSAEASNPPPTFNLLRQRTGQSQAYLVDGAAIGGPISDTGHMIRQEFTVQFTEQDNGATFFCEVSTHGVMESVARSDGKQFNVTYPPRGILVNMDPIGSVAESVSKVFTCQLNMSGSNPPSELIWTQLDSAGALLPLEDDVNIQPTEQINGECGAFVARSKLTVVARRAINGRRFECTAVYQNKKTMLRAEEILEVKFAPNNVGLTALPMDGVRESQRLDLTCATSSCHPPAVIRWYEVTNQGAMEDDEDSWTIRADPSKPNELSDLAQMDTKPGKFGGTEVSSKLTVTKTYRLHQGTVFRCVVEHPAMEKPVISEHRLQVLYPTMVQLISHPPEPVVGQTVLLSCETSGGNPQTGFTYSWFVADRFQLAGLLSESVGNRTSDRFKSKPALSAKDQSSNDETHPTKRPSEPTLKNMLRLVSHQDAQLNLTNVKLSQRGWYACQVASAGGVSHSSYYLDLFYQPRIDRRTRSRVQAHVGETVAFKLYVDANPPWAEAIWFQLNNDDQSVHPSSATSTIGDHRPDAFFVGYHPYLGYDELYDYNVGVVRVRRTATGLNGKTRVQVGTGKTERANIVAQKGTGEQENLTFILNFYDVKPDDFGDYVCQLRHKLGVKEFPFQLIQKSESEGIVPSSVSVVQRGSTTVVRFRPPGNPRFSRLVLRVCKRGTFITRTKRSNNQTTENVNMDSSQVQLYHQVRHKRVSGRKLDETRNDTDTDANGDTASNTENNRRTIEGTRTDGSKECEDYLVAKPHTGETEVHLSEAVQLYNFRLILYQGTHVLQETPPVVWQPELSSAQREMGIPMIALAVTGGCLVLILLLIVAATFVVCHNKRKPSSFATPGKTKDNFTPSSGNQCALSDDAEVHRLRACGLAFEMRSDMGSIRSYQPSEVETIPLMQQMLGHGVSPGSYDPRNGGMTPTRSPRNLSLIDGDYGITGQGQHRLSHTSSHGTNMTMLSNRVITEAYLAAARAASEAVAASVVSGSTDLYSPSTQLTGDLSSLMAENGTDGEKDTGGTGASTNHRHSHPAEGTESANVMSPKSVKSNARKSSDPAKIRQSVRSPNMNHPNPSDLRMFHQAPNRGSRLSVQMGTRSSRSHSQCGSLSGNSLSSLRNSSQLSLEAAARAAAAAAVASVVQNMNAGLLMQHAASSTNLVNPYTLRRPSSRAASVIGPASSMQTHKLANGSGDGESLHSAAFGSRYIGHPGSSTGEITPTTSLNHFDPNGAPQGPQQLTVPTIQQVQMAQRFQQQLRNDPRHGGAKLQRPTMLHQIHGLPPLDTSSKGSYEPYKAHSPTSSVSDRGQNSMHPSHPHSPSSPTPQPSFIPTGPSYGFVGPNAQTHALIQPMANFRVPPQSTLNQYQLQQLQQIQLHHQRQQQLLQMQQQQQQQQQQYSQTTMGSPTRSYVSQIQKPLIVTSPPPPQPASSSVAGTGLSVASSQPAPQSSIQSSAIKPLTAPTSTTEQVTVHHITNEQTASPNKTRGHSVKSTSTPEPAESRGVGEGQMEESMFLVRDDPAQLGSQTPVNLRSSTVRDKSEPHSNTNKPTAASGTTNNDDNALDESAATTPIPSRRNPDEVANHCTDASSLEGTLKSTNFTIPSARQPPMGASSQPISNGCLGPEDQINRDSEISPVHSPQNNSAQFRQQQPRLGVQSTLLANRSIDRLPSPPAEMAAKRSGSDDDRAFVQAKLVKQNGDRLPQPPSNTFVTPVEDP